ncbi:EamA family transporter, partial [Enterobacter hormaechei subsp. steigerwaltii]|nr:EamA family transporter [Enterobacter hormaechei subsp. steigerwaltii]MCU2575289.1 EamA family transporter [Enterobacter hormaechei subsp. steigerwaltii]MCU2620467.1 EamA family transporter [Enterobacter hormaechei subsp. steigerwaltii]
MVRNLIVGLFLQSFFLGGCFYAIHRGMPSGIVALITGLQPVLTAILVSLMHRQSLHPRKWLGIAIGFAGVFLVLSPGQHSFALDPVAFGSVMLGLFGVTIGALYQRRAQGDGHIFANTF